MIENNQGKKLIRELLSEPALFFENGKSFDLLDEYFKGLELGTLIPLLNSDDESVLKSAIWIASELATRACDLFPYVVQHINHGNRYIRYYSMEFTMLCSVEGHQEAFLHIIESLHDQDPTIQILGMQLLSNASAAQLKMAINFLSKSSIKDCELHQTGLSALLNVENIDEQRVLNMLRDERHLIQIYGAVLIKKRGVSSMELIKNAIDSNNIAVREFILTLQNSE